MVKHVEKARERLPLLQGDLYIMIRRDRDCMVYVGSDGIRERTEEEGTGQPREQRGGGLESLQGRGGGQDEHFHAQGSGQLGSAWGFPGKDE